MSLSVPPAAHRDVRSAMGLTIALSAGDTGGLMPTPFDARDTVIIID